MTNASFLFTMEMKDGVIMKEVLIINNLNKSYGNLKAVNNLSLKVKKGELFAFLGINGAGKSTTISMICGNLEIDSGTIEVCGYDIKNKENTIKNKIGVVFQNSVLDQSLSVYDNLKYRASLYDITGKDFLNRYDELSKLFELKEIETQKVGKLSGGQRRRVDIARAIIHKPEFLILDEPTTGLDPQTRKKLWKIIRDLREKNEMTVFLTTHYMEEASDADYIVILDKGKIITEGTPLELKTIFAKDTVYIYNVSEDEIKKLKCKYTKIRSGYKIEVDTTEEVTNMIIKNKDLFKDYEVVKGKIDDVFLKATGNELEEN